MNDKEYDESWLKATREWFENGNGIFTPDSDLVYQKLSMKYWQLQLLASIADSLEKIASK